MNGQTAKINETGCSKKSVRREEGFREESGDVLVVILMNKGKVLVSCSGSGSSSGSGLVSSFFSFPIILARDDKQETKTQKGMNEKGRTKKAKA